MSHLAAAPLARDLRGAANRGSWRVHPPSYVSPAEKTLVAQNGDAYGEGAVPGERATFHYFFALCLAREGGLLFIESPK